MNKLFEHQLDQQLLRSEKRRTIMLMVIFVAAICIRLIKLAVAGDGDTSQAESFSTIWFFPVSVMLFELFCYLYIRKRIRRSGKRIPLRLQFINTVFEILLPSCIIFLIAKEYPGFDILQSPIIYIYFIFIILSTLRLNFLLSFSCGLIASAAYLLFSVCIYHRFGTNDAARCFTLLAAGIAAGMVASQIRNSINHSLRESEKRQKAEHLFGQQISPEIARRMLDEEGRMESRRMYVAIMFIDIRNFTAFASRKAPEEIVQYQNDFFSLVIGVVIRHHGVVNQILGDGCMISFGAPLPMQNPAKTAALAAREIIHELEVAMEEGKLPETRVGIGIHTGDAVTGNIGTDLRRQYSITGNVVIAASRIEQLNKEFDSQLLVSEEVALSLDGLPLPSELLGTFSLKGMENLYRIYKLA